VHCGWCVFPLYNQSLLRLSQTIGFLVTIILGSDSWILIIILWLNPKSFPFQQHTSKEALCKHQKKSPKNLTVAADFWISSDDVFAVDFWIGSYAFFAVDFWIGSDVVFFFNFWIGGNTILSTDFLIGSYAVFAVDF